MDRRGLRFLLGRRSVAARTLTLTAWARSLRGVEETACFALDDPLPFLMMGLADCGELYRWLRCQSAAKLPVPETRRPRVTPRLQPSISPKE